MNETDLIILVIYLICIVYVLYQAFDDLEDQTTYQVKAIVFEDDTRLNNRVDIKFDQFKDGNRFKFSENPEKVSGQPKTIEVTVVNKFHNASIRLDWDNSTISDYRKRARRVIRLTPGMTEVPQTQAQSLVAPGLSLKANVTAEEVLKQNQETGLVEPIKPLVDIADLPRDFENKKLGKKTQREIEVLYTNFMDRKASLEFSLRLLLLFSEFVNGVKQEYGEFVECQFIVTKVPLLDQLPWTPKPKQ
jgi:hypothetical protein